jgi:hypothetical protein
MISVDALRELRDLSAVSTEAVGAIFCLEASRLARHGREWQQQSTPRWRL